MTDGDRIALLYELLARVRRRSFAIGDSAGTEDMDQEDRTLPPPVALMEEEPPVDTLRFRGQPTDASPPPLVAPPPIAPPPIAPPPIAPPFVAPPPIAPPLFATDLPGPMWSADQPTSEEPAPLDPALFTDENAPATEPPPPGGPVFDEEPASRPPAISTLSIDLPTDDEVPSDERPSIPMPPREQTEPPPATEKGDRLRASMDDVARDLSSDFADAERPLDLSDIEEPPISSSRPIAEFGVDSGIGGGLADVLEGDVPAPPQTPPPESGLLPPVAGRRSSSPASLDVQPHHVQGAWREPGVPEEASRGPSTSPPPMGGPPEQIHHAPADPAVLVAEIIEGEVRMEDAVLEVEGAPPSARPRTFGELLDAALAL